MIHPSSQGLGQPCLSTVGILCWTVMIGTWLKITDKTEHLVFVFLLENHILGTKTTIIPVIEWSKLTSKASPSFSSDVVVADVLTSCESESNESRLSFSQTSNLSPDRILPVSFINAVKSIARSSADGSTRKGSVDRPVNYLQAESTDRVIDRNGWTAGAVMQWSKTITFARNVWSIDRNSVDMQCVPALDQMLEACTGEKQVRCGGAGKTPERVKSERTIICVFFLFLNDKISRQSKKKIITWKEKDE